MFNLVDFESTKNIFSHAGNQFYEDHNNQHHLKCRPKDLIRWIEFIKEDLGYLTLVDIVGIDHYDSQVGDSETRFELVYHFLNMGQHQRVNLHVHFNEDELVPSIKYLFPHSEWMEREQKEMLNINLDKNLAGLILPNEQKNFPLRKHTQFEKWPEVVVPSVPKLRFNPNKSEMPYPEESYVWKSYDIFSRNTLGNFDCQVCYDPHLAKEAQVQVGFHHQGLEKFFQNKDWFQVLNLVDKINLGAAPTYSMAWARVLEDTLGIKLPERAEAIRIVMLELARVAEHLTVLAEITLELSLEESKHFLNAREKVFELFEKYCGHRQGMGIIRLAGVREDLPHGWIIEFQSLSDILKKTLRIINNSLMGQPRFRERLSGASVNAQTILKWGIGGPTMRASGLNFDLRKSTPFYFYSEIDFDIPVGIHGTAYDRYLIRFEEIFQSLRIITQVLDNLPLGDFVNKDFDQSIQVVKDIIKKEIVPLKWHYSSLESPNGEAGFLLLPDKDLSARRMKIKTPSFVLAQAFSQLIIGVNEEDFSANLASLAIRRFEMDR